MPVFPVGAAEDFQPDQVKVVRVRGERLGVVLAEGKFYCFEDVCTHDDGPLGEGPLMKDCQIECPRHGARFDIRDGHVTRAPAITPLEVFDVEVVDGQVRVHLPE